MKLNSRSTFWHASKVMLMVLFTSLWLSSCEEDTDLPKIDFNIQLVATEELPIEELSGIEVVLNYNSKDYTLTSITDENGIASFTEVEPGEVSITCNFLIEKNNHDVAVNASIVAQLTEDQVLQLNLIIQESGGLIIKEYYYAGCLDAGGGNYFLDQFITVVNNTASNVYADGLSIVEYDSYSTDNDWAEYMDSFIIVKSIWTIPGGGEDIPLEPGENLVLAMNAFDHHTDSTLNSPVDLKNADFEFYLENDLGGRDRDNGAKNLIEDYITFRGSDFRYDTQGGSSIALVWLPGDREKYIDNHFVESEKGRLMCMIPNQWVEDAVCSARTANNVKVFAPSLDAGVVWNETSGRSGLCIRRKVREVIDGVTYYQDTNNSTVDFETDVVPDPWDEIAD